MVNNGISSTSTSSPVAGNARVVATEQQQPAVVFAQNQDEGVLHDVLQQLDRERARRAEVEAKMRQLTQELEDERAKPKLTQPETEETIITRRIFVAMETQVKGFQQLVDALTLGKPAIAAAAQAAALSTDGSNSNKSLPLHVVRLLEVIPWDPRAQEHIFGFEQIFEWQIFDERENKWHSNVRHFPALFKSLPIVRTTPDGGKIQHDGSAGTAGSKDRSVLLFLAGGGGEKAASSPSKHGVLTDENITCVYNIEAGYPLPHDGGRWEWIGGWHVEKQQQVKNQLSGDSREETLLCDENGWSYAFDAQNFIAIDASSSGAVSGSVLGETTTLDNGGPKRDVRRRKWTRRRVLVEYPMASERTLQYLKVVAENARLSITVSKINEQLVQTKMALTETEETLVQTKAALEKQEAVVRAVGVDVEELALVEKTTDGSSNPVQDFLNKTEVREIGSKLHSWVKQARKTSEDLTSCESGDDDGIVKTRGTDDTATPQKFHWKKIGRGGLIDKLARPSPGSGRLGLRGGANSNGSGALLSGSVTYIEEPAVEPVGED